jgi:hypothetical protein
MMESQAGPAQGQPFAEAVFVALDGINELTSRVGDAPGRATIGFQDIYSYATDPDRPMSPGLRQALQSDERLRAGLRRLLQRTAPLHLAARAAASGGTITTRQGEGFRMTLRESRAERGQIYVIIRFADAVLPPPKLLFVVDDDSGFRKLSLPAPSAGAVQLLLEADSDLVTALRDPRTEVFMR